MIEKEIRVRRPELLAPAGSFEKLVTAIHYGADAVYCAGKRYGLRARAANFSEEGLEEAVDYAHAHRVKLYVAVNILAHDRDLAGLDEYLAFLGRIGVDGLIVADPGILVRAARLIPGIPIHLSTQANVTNVESALFWCRQGARRLNLARELSLTEISAITAALAASGLVPPRETELFVHGALCISYSGRCLLSSYLTGRDANQGDCAHPCRYRYRLEEEKRPGEFFPVEEDEYGTYIFNSRDLCLLHRLGDLTAAGADSFKIEGRMKSTFYVGAVVRLYRAALDFLRDHLGEPLPPLFREELARVGTRGYTENFIDSPPGPREMLYDTPRTVQEWVPAGVVRRLLPAATVGGPGMEMEVRNTLRQGEILEFMGHGLQNIAFPLAAMRNPEGESLIRAHPGNIIRIEGLPASAWWRENGLVRKKPHPAGDR